MYQAYQTYHEKRPLWQNNKRPRWWRRRVRSGGVCFILALGAVTAVTVLLAMRRSSIHYQHYEVYKSRIQGKNPTDTGDSRHSANVLTQQQTRKADENSSSEKWEAQMVLSHGSEPADNDFIARAQPVVQEHSGPKDAEGASSLTLTDKVAVAKTEDSGVTLMENNLVIDNGPKPRLSPDGGEGEELGRTAGSEGPLVEDESNESQQHLSLEQKAESLPEFVWVPFAKAVEEEVLQGWEDDWVSNGRYDEKRWGQLQEPKVDFVYLWVNGSEEDFQKTIRPWEERSVLNDPDGKWINSHGVNRYRDWDELRYSFRSIERNAGHFLNKVKVLVNSIYEAGVPVRKQSPTWLAVEDPKVLQTVQIVSQEEMFETDKAVCLPTFNSLTIENQMFNTESEVDQFFAMSDDMLLTREHSPADIYSPLFGAAISFKTNGYSTTSPPTDVDARRFGEKPYLIYTSWLLNRRFGIRKRKGQSHFGHSLSRSIMKEAIEAFPRPEVQSACKRFRGEPGFQLYSWYMAYHYQIERHREVLLWSYIMLRSDIDRDGILSWEERQSIAHDLAAGTENAGRASFRRKMFYHVPSLLEKAGLKPPQVNTNSLWTSLDGPMAIRDADCAEFNIDECLAPGFLTDDSEASNLNPTFSSAVIFDRLARQNPRCGDCLLKGLLYQTASGLSPLLPHKGGQQADRDLVIKAVMRYKYIVVDPSDTLFVMITDADQIDSTLYRHFVKEQRPLPGQICLNDDVVTTDEQELKDVQSAIRELLQGLFPEQGVSEIPIIP